MKDAQLAKACLERDSKKKQMEQMEDEKDKLVAHADLLKRLVSSHMIDLYIQCKMTHMWELTAFTTECISN